jgi:fimbrial chaperone protein
MSENMKQYKLAAKFAFLAAFFFVTDAHSAGYNINPLRVYLDGKTRSGTVVVENLSDQILTIQASMNSWAQENGKVDLVFPTEDLVVSPPIFKVQPKSKQVVRIGNLKKPDAILEGAYRLILQEVPPPRKPDDTGVAVAVRSSLPVFIAPTSGKTQAILKSKTEPVDDRNIKLTMTNSGTGHIQISAINIRLPDGSLLASAPSMMIYILPGQSQTTNITTDKPWKSEALRVLVKSDTGAPGVELEVKPE